MGRGSSKDSKNQPNQNKRSFARDGLTSVVLLDLLLYGTPSQRAARERRKAEKWDEKEDANLNLIVGFVIIIVFLVLVIIVF